MSVRESLNHEENRDLVGDCNFRDYLWLSGKQLLVKLFKLG